MNNIRKLYKRIQEGMLQEILVEIGWIYRHALLYKKEILWYVFMGILGTAMGLGASVVSKYIIDAVTGKNSQYLLIIGTLYVSLQLLQIGMNAWASRINAKIHVKVDQEIRGEVYDKVMNADWEAMSEYHSGDILNRVDNDVTTVSGSVLGWVPDFITRTVQFVGALAIILYYDPTLAVLALLSAPVTLLFSRTMAKKLRNYSKEMSQIGSKIMAFNEESFQNIQVIKSFGLTKIYSRKLREVQKEHRRARLNFNVFSVNMSSLLSLVGTLVGILCFGWGVHRLWTGHITFGTMTLFLQLAVLLASSFSSLVHMVPSAISAATAAGRIMAISELPAEDFSADREAEEFVKTNHSGGIKVTAKDVAFGYEKGELVFSHASFQASPGEIVALVGPSGEGKTTMLRLLLGIINPREGVIEVQGAENQKTLSISPSTRRLFAYVPQGNTMFSGTVAENLRLMKRDASDEELYEVLRLACAERFIQKLPDGINSPVQEQGGGFSQGQIQRLSIARALLADVPILLLDEATSALDIATERKVLRNITNSTRRRTCIVTTHRPSVLEICHRVYRISDGNMTKVTEQEVQEMIKDF